MTLNDTHHSTSSQTFFSRKTQLLLIPVMMIALNGCLNTTANNPEVDAFANNDTTDTTPPAATNKTGSTPGTGPTTGLKAVFSGANHSCAIKNVDSSLWCWGRNNSAQLADSTGINSGTAKQITNSSGWLSFDGGPLHSCGISIDNLLRCWGENSDGRLGDGTFINAASPKLIISPAADGEWSKISTGTDHSCGIASDKTLWCWGNNDVYQLGDNTTTQRGAPTAIFGSNTDWVATSSGNQFSCAIKEIVTNSNEGNIFCWGLNDKGQLGLGNLITQQTPTVIPDNDWISVKTGYSFTCGIKSNQTLYCWGDNSYGQLGLGNTTNQSSATQVGSDTDWISISTGYYHTCGIRDDGLTPPTLWCWGNNDAGQLGIGSTAHRATPQQISNSRGWLSVTTGESHTCAVDKDYVSYCWGLNSYGQLGNGVTINTSNPVKFDSSTNWLSIDSGRYHTCGLKDDNTLWCGGINSFGQLGNGSTTNQSSPVQVTAANGAITTWASFATGHHHTCAIASDNSLYCWGSDTHGQLGDGDADYSNIAAHWAPKQVTGVGADTDWVSITAGASHTCGIKNVNELWCWGDNSTDQMGNGSSGTTPKQSSPIRVYEDGAAATIPFVALDVAVGGYVDTVPLITHPAGGHTCAIKTTDNTLWCWGENDKSQLGDGSITNRTIPTQIGVDIDWTIVKAGARHTCAKKTDDTIYCWGDDTNGQVGTGTNTPTWAPDIVTHPSSVNWTSFDLGERHSCAYDVNNKIYCWGDNSANQLTALIATTSATAPLLANNATTWQDLALGKEHSCGISQDTAGDRTTLCWGTNAEFQLGDDSAWKTTPQQLTLQ